MKYKAFQDGKGIGSIRLGNHAFDADVNGFFELTKEEANLLVQRTKIVFIPQSASDQSVSKLKKTPSTSKITRHSDSTWEPVISPPGSTEGE
jgi:hypothetical protein